jgi:hypothetical protein
MTAARMSAAPTRDPTTMPAIAPPERPVPEFPAPAPAPAVWVGAEEEVEVKSGGIDVVVGSSTPSHRVSTLALTQQESVALGELEAQKEQRPGRLDE